MAGSSSESERAVADPDRGVVLADGLTLTHSTSSCTVADAVEAAWLAEAATESLRRHAPVHIEEVRA